MCYFLFTPFALVGKQDTCGTPTAQIGIAAKNHYCKNYQSMKKRGL
nr:hypothetical protein [uncultured bacterium]